MKDVAARGTGRWMGWPVAVAAGVLAAIGPGARAQRADATATQPLALSAFGAATGTWTDIEGGRNLGITAGADLAFLTFRRYRPVIEVRGTYPVYDGQVDAQRSLMGGLRVERDFYRFHPYVDFLVGRGAADYQRGGLFYNGLLYFRTTSTVYSPGLGVDYDVTPHWAAKVDFQYQHWDVPVVPDGVVNPRALSLGAVYRFDFNHHYKVRRERGR